MDVSKLEKCEPKRLQDQTVTAVILALGSNYKAEYYLPRIRKQLTVLGAVQLSTSFQNPDFTATLEQPKPDYTNQCVYLSLTDTMTLQRLQQMFKRLEGDCDRRRQADLTTIRQVTMDIDVLLIKLIDIEEWTVMADRYPFKAHESAGIVELAAGRGFSF